MFRRYVELSEQDEKFASLRPYHFTKASSGTFEDPEICDELLRKKFEALLGEHDCSLPELLLIISNELLMSPLVEMIAEQSVEVSMKAVGKKFSHSPEQMFRRYAKLSGQEEEFASLRPYPL